VGSHKSSGLRNTGYGVRSVYLRWQSAGFASKLRSLPLKFRFRCNSEIRRRISPLRLIDPEEIEIALNCSACAYTDL
jgi:hypothetical protein